MTLPKLQAEWLSSPQTIALAEMFKTGGATARFVGGVVRNTLLGQPVSDLDVATNARPERVMQWAQRAGFRAIGTGLQHGTVTLVVDHVVYEITTLRVDVQTDGRHAQVAFTGDWRKDAQRRDFTMNALYCDFDGTLFDPLAGYADLKARRVRFIGQAEDRIREDFLRILRFFRFSAQYGEGKPDPSGLSACVRLQAGMKSLSRERIGAEMVRLLVARRAGELISVMFSHGLLLPLVGLVPQPSRFLRWLELEETLGRRPNAMHRLGALFMMEPQNGSRLVHSLRLSNQQKHLLKLWTKGKEMNRETSPQEARRLCYALRDDYQAHVMISWLHSGASASDPKWRKLHDLPDHWQPPTFPLTGKDLIHQGQKPGPHIGRTLRQLEQKWLENDFTLDKQTLLAIPPAHLSSHQA